MDMWHKLVQWIDYNRGLALAIVLAALLCVGFASCEPRTDSVLNEGETVTATGLKREAAQIKAAYKAKLAMLAAAKADIEDQVILRTRIIELVGSLGTAALEGTASPAAGVAGLIQVATLCALGGTAYDNRRKNGKIKELKQNGAA